MNKTILVTGAMGQLGRRVTQILLARGRTVIALDIRNAATFATAEQLQTGAGNAGKLVPAFVNLVDAKAVTKVIVEYSPDVIVHLAAIVSPVCYTNPEFAHKVNVEGTRNLVQAATLLRAKPLFVEASSSAVYGSRNPHTHPELITSETPVNPVECYGEDKVLAERIVAESGLPHATLRLGGIISPDAMASSSPEYLLLMRATPRDNRLHAVDARDAALAFANATDVGAKINGKVLLIGGNKSYVKLQSDLQDDLMQAIGIGRLGPSTGLPGNPDDDRGWGLTDWFDTTETQNLLDFQKHNWQETLRWIAEAQGHRLIALRLLGPVLRPLMRTFLAVQRQRERRGKYADPWTLVSKKYGERILSPTASYCAPH